MGFPNVVNSAPPREPIRPPRKYPSESYHPHTANKDTHSKEETSTLARLREMNATLKTGPRQHFVRHE